jgi:hypothetical protein
MGLPITPRPINPILLDTVVFPPVVVSFDFRTDLRNARRTVEDLLPQPLAIEACMPVDFVRLPGPGETVHPKDAALIIPRHNEGVQESRPSVVQGNHILPFLVG